MDQISIGRFIADMRKRKNMTQRELADILLISDKTVSKWESGKGLPEVSLMRPLADALGVTVDELLAGELIARGSANNELIAGKSANVKPAAKSGKESAGRYLAPLLTACVLLGILHEIVSQKGLIYSFIFALYPIAFLRAVYYIKIFSHSGEDELVEFFDSVALFRNGFFIFPVICCLLAWEATVSYATVLAVMAVFFAAEIVATRIRERSARSRIAGDDPT
ncbi:MAG: helix-turn-helix transcriptional regulator [Anaerovoracaceae bacterium]|nr:helix-turn-helix transcriptional regulator [Anaerovoracaceae bacterium]